MAENIYKNWKIQKWETAISDFKSARLERLMDSDQLEIIIQEGVGDDLKRVKFTFTGQYAYRNINESYRTDLWAQISDRYGWSWKVTQSDLLKLLKEDDIGKDLFKKAIQYVILTEDDIIEIVSDNEPHIEILGSAKNDSELPGKSKIVFKR